MRRWVAEVIAADVCHAVDAVQGNAHVVVRPNRSLSWRGNLLVIVSLGLIMFTIASGFALIGLWLVLPFAGLELLALGVALRWSLVQGQRRELISVEDSRVLVRKTGRQGPCEFEFVRPWTRVELVDARAANWPRRLLLRSKGRAVEVGGFLTDSERTSLGKRLAELIPGMPGRELPVSDDTASVGTNNSE